MLIKVVSQLYQIGRYLLLQLNVVIVLLTLGTFLEGCIFCYRNDHCLPKCINFLETFLSSIDVGECRLFHEYQTSDEHQTTRPNKFKLLC